MIQFVPLLRSKNIMPAAFKFLVVLICFLGKTTGAPVGRISYIENIRVSYDNGKYLYVYNQSYNILTKF